MKLPLRQKIICLLFFLLFGFVLAKSALAFISKPNYQEVFERSVYKEKQIDQPSFTNETVRAITASLITQLIGCITEECPSNDQINKGAVGGVSNLIATLYAYPPASGVQYLADLSKNLGIITPAYAQTGTGWTNLQSILPLWKAFRNIAYLFFTIIFIAIGFAIMFRVKISPQAVVTIQSALPRIIIALILVTFSYAIAGFLIDLIYVGFLVLISGLESGGGITHPEYLGLEHTFLKGEFLSTIGTLVGRGATALKDIIGGLIPGL